MTKYNPRYLLPNNRTNTVSNFTNRGNSYVYDWGVGQRIFETKNFWRLQMPTTVPGGLSINAQAQYLIISKNGVIQQYASSPAIDTASESWTVRTTPMPFPMGVAFLNGVWYLVGFNSSGHGVIYTSSDAITWTLRVTNASAGNTFVAVSVRFNFGLSRYEVIVFPGGANNTAQCTVDNGVTWTTQSTNAVTAHSDSGGSYYIGFGNGGLAYGVAGPYAPTAITSPFGATSVTALAQQSAMASLEVVAATANNSFAVSNGNPATSWTIVPSPPLSSGENIISIYTRTGPAVGKASFTAITSRNRVFNFDFRLDLSPRMWQDISPQTIDSGSTLNYLPFLNYARLGITNNNSASNGIYRTEIY